jgi:spermidine synthase
VPKKRRRGAPRTLPVRVEPRGSDGLALIVGGVTQSVTEQAAANGYWELMLPPGCPRNALLLGLGGGTVAQLLAWRCPDTRMLGLERDAAVLAIARETFGLASLRGLRIIEGDAFAWVDAQFTDEGQTLADHAERFDLICVDLFDAGRMVSGVLATRFLRRLAALLTTDGIASFNLMVTGRTPEQFHRLRRVFSVVREQRLGGNIVVHLSALPADQRMEEPESAQ